MMTPETRPGTYTDAWPNGPWISTSDLDRDVLFLRVNSDGAVVGKGHEGADGGLALLRRPADWLAQHPGAEPWISLGQTAGNAPVAFGPEFVVYVARFDAVYVYSYDGTVLRTIPGYVGANGIRDVRPDGSMVTGDASYFDGHWLSEYTELSDGTRIGQGHETGGIVAMVDGVPRQVHRGADVFVHAHEVAGLIAIAWWGEQGSARIPVTTVADLRALPPIADAVPAPIPPSVPVPPPPEPKPMEFPNHLDIVQVERARYGATISDAEAFAITNAVALHPEVRADGWGLTKAGGGHGVIANGVNYRVDKLCHPAGFINDILGAAGGGTGTAQWGPNPDPNGNPANWAPALAAPQGGGTPLPAPQPPPAPPLPVDVSGLTARIGALESALNQYGVAFAHLQAQIDAITVAPSSSVKHGDPVTVTGSISWSSVLRGEKVTWGGVIK